MTVIRDVHNHNNNDTNRAS